MTSQQPPNLLVAPDAQVEALVVKDQSSVGLVQALLDLVLPRGIVRNGVVGDEERHPEPSHLCCDLVDEHPVLADVRREDEEGLCNPDSGWDRGGGSYGARRHHQVEVFGEFEHHTVGASCKELGEAGAVTVTTNGAHLIGGQDQGLLVPAHIGELRRELGYESDPCLPAEQVCPSRVVAWPTGRVRRKAATSARPACSRRRRRRCVGGALAGGGVAPVVGNTLLPGLSCERATGIEPA